VDVLGERGDLFAGEATGRIAGHLRHVAVDEAVVGAARTDDLASDVTEAGLVLPGTHGGTHLRGSERPLEQPVRQLEVVAMAVHEGVEAGRGLGDEGLGHALRQVVGRSRRPPLLRVARDRRRRRAFGGCIGEPLGVHLVIVDRLSALGARAPGAERLVQDGAGSCEDGGGGIRHDRAI
jgi:hypothetical protein